MANHAIVNLEKIQAGVAGNLESLVHTADLDNGSFVFLGAPVTGEREVVNVEIPATAKLATDEVILVSSPEELYYPGQTLKDFYTPAGKIARGIHLTAGDVFTIADLGFDGTSVVGQFLTAQDGSVKGVISTTLPTGRFAAEVIRKGFIGYGNAFPATTFKVVQC